MTILYQVGPMTEFTYSCFLNKISRLISIILQAVKIHYFNNDYKSTIQLQQDLHKCIVTGRLSAQEQLSL